MATILVIVVSGCTEDEPPVTLQDGGEPGPPSDVGVAPAWLAPLWDGPLLTEPLPIEPRAGWSSPPSCPVQWEDTACWDCYAQPNEPWFLDANESGDRFGESMAIADFNGDGYPDLAIGAPGEDVGSNADAGAVYLYLGTERGFEPWRVLHFDLGYGTSPAGAQFGSQLAAADFTDDGLADLVVALGSQDLTQSAQVYQGMPYGMAHLQEITLAYVDPDGWAEDFSELGASMAVGDFNDDGVTDLALGAPGQYVWADSETTGAVYIVPGDGSALDIFSATRLVPSALSMSVTSGMRFGEVLAVGEMTGTGGHDVAVGVTSEESVHVFESGSTALVLLGLSMHTGLGASVIAGDMGTDGVAEVLAGGTGTTTIAAFEEIDSIGFTPHALGFPGVALAVGRVEGSTDQLFTRWSDMSFVQNPVVAVGNLYGSTAGWNFHIGESVPREDDDAFGRRVLLEDVDGDARMDVIVAAPSEPGSGSGRVYVFAVDDVNEWTDVERWIEVWGLAGHEHMMTGDPPYMDPMPVQVITQETTPGECDGCYVFDRPNGEVCSEDPLLACFEGACTTFCLSQEDGEPCGETEAEVCSSGVCITRTGCGDGYREPYPGTMTWPREGCDDGNALDDDACSSACEPTRLVVSSEPLEDASPASRGPAMAEDDRGELLFVYTADAGEGRELRARRYSAVGEAHEEGGAPIIVASRFGVGWDLEPSVAGLFTEDGSGGWIVAWTDPAADGDGAGIALRRISPTGVPGPLRVINNQRLGSQRSPRVFGFPGGHGLVWVDEGGVDGPLGASIIKLRAFANDGTVFIDEQAVSAVDAVASEPAVAIADGLLMVWTQASDTEGELSYIMGSLFGGSIGEPFVIAGPGASQPAVTWFSDGPIVLTWVRRDPTYDYLGDVLVGVLDPTNIPPSLLATWTITERQGTDPPRAELAPSIAFLNEGAVIAYEDGGHRRGVGFGDIGDVLPPEATDLAGYLVNGLQGDVTTLRTSRGVWFAWSDASGYGDEDAYRSFLAYLLPHD